MWLKLWTALMNRRSAKYYGILNTCSKAFEKLILPELRKKTPIFHGIKKFIYVFASTRHLSPTWSQMTPAGVTPACFLTIHFSVILPSIPMNSSWFLSSRLPQQSRVGISLLSHAYNMPYPSQPPWSRLKPKIHYKQKSWSSSFYATFSSLALLPPPKAQTNSSAPHSRTSPAYVFSLMLRTHLTRKARL